ncbi:zinc finger CW-type PWWP domain protein 2 [Talpa occidentalis]|uniref:zinc finger CW-type PWWP domain protein 2 n=2 Tax=Talpa occidentalis TaxID=50954 RepID=UPI0023F7AA4E|nr:zinc finger CW-type PWWP domain protein 2 [Talpa occidentalis]
MSNREKRSEASPPPPWAGTAGAGVTGQRPPRVGLPPAGGSAGLWAKTTRLLGSATAATAGPSPARTPRPAQATHPEDGLRRAAPQTAEFRFPSVCKRTENKPGRQGSPRASGFLEDAAAAPAPAAAPGTARRDSHFLRLGHAGNGAALPVSGGPESSGRKGERSPAKAGYPTTRARRPGPPARAGLVRSRARRAPRRRGGPEILWRGPGEGRAAAAGERTSAARELDVRAVRATGSQAPGSGEGAREGAAWVREGRGGASATPGGGGGAGFNAFVEKKIWDGKKIIEYYNTAMDSSVENNMYVNKVWVQCEDESCLKWRLLSSEDAGKVDHNEPWYCFMNTDSRYNECSISEEDFPEESQFHQSGFKIVYSQLPLGSLVLVKLQNWPSWPGILCPDPFKGKYVTYDLDGNVEEYHIEFLGDPRSQSWIGATFVGHYSITFKPGKCKNKKKKWYESALQEACLLHGYSHEQRLEMCCLLKHDESKADAEVGAVAKKRMQVSKNNTEKRNPKFRKRKRKTILKSSFENICSDDALSKENMVVSETEILLKELEQMLQQALEPTTRDESEEECEEEINMEEKLSKCTPEAPVGSPFGNHYEEDYLVIDGIKLKAGECIENITDKFKEIDALMSEI